MIRFDNLKLHNFRCFEDCEVRFEPDLTIFVARNGQGKTAILDALALALGLFVDNISGTNTWGGFQKRDIRLIREGTNTIKPEGFVLFEAAALVDGHNLAWRRWMRTHTKREVTSKSEAKPLIGKSKEIHARLQVRDPANDLVLPLIAYFGTGRRWRNGNERATSPTSNAVNERCLGYADCLSGTANYGLFIDWYQRAFQSLGKRTPVTGTKKADRPEFLLDAVNRAVESVLEPETGWRGLYWEEGNDNGRLMLEHPIHGQLPLDFLSDGVRNTAALVADVAHRCARLNPHLDDAAKQTAGILIIDEVDLHLHPEWQQRIIKMLRLTFPKLQLIFTTHSPQVLSTVYAKQIRVLSVTDGRIEIRQPDFQTRGVESADVLHRIMRVDPAPQVREAEWLNEYRALIEDGRDETEKGVDLKADLVAHFGEEHPLMLDFDRLIRFTRFKRRRANEGEH